MNTTEAELLSSLFQHRQVAFHGKRQSRAVLSILKDVGSLRLSESDSGVIWLTVDPVLYLTHDGAPHPKTIKHAALHESVKKLAKGGY